MGPATALRHSPGLGCVHRSSFGEDEGSAVPHTMFMKQVCPPATVWIPIVAAEESRSSELEERPGQGPIRRSCSLQPENFVSRSWIRKRGEVSCSSSVQATFRACWVTQAESGFRVAPATCTLPVPSSTKNSTYSGTVALAEAWARCTHTLGQVSDDESQFGERVGQTKGRTDIGPEIVEAPAEVLNEGVRGDDDPGGTVSLQSSHGAKSSLQASVVGLERVVGMDLGVMEGRRQQRARIDSVPIGGDLDGRDSGPIDRSLQEVAGCFGVPGGERKTSMTRPNWSMARNR